MGVNMDRPERWKEDIVRSVELYNEWFLRFAPQTFSEQRRCATERVREVLCLTNYLRAITPRVLADNPRILPVLRMLTAPPLARDRLAGLANVKKHLLTQLEKNPQARRRTSRSALDEQLERLVARVRELLDPDLCPWSYEQREPLEEEVHRALSIVADRLTGADADPVIRNAQEERQLHKIECWLSNRRYTKVGGRVHVREMKPGTFAFRVNAEGVTERGRRVKVPVDVVVMPHGAQPPSLPLMIEAKSAGDYTNTNKRRKEEATKVDQLRRKYGTGVQYILFLCGYFDSKYLHYEADKGIDWVWEHRIDDLTEFGL